MFKRIVLFLVVNFLVILTLSGILSLFNVKPYLNAYGLDYRSLMIFCSIWGMVGAFISLSMSRIMAKWMLGVKLVDSNHPLYNMVQRLSQKAGLPEVPQVGIYPSNEVNAFATGPTKSRSLVAVSQGLLDKMEQSQLEGVISHEIAHIANGDMVTMTLIQGVVNAFVMFLARVLAYAASGLGSRDRKSSQSGGSYMSYTLFVYLFDFVFMLLGSMVIAWFSRKREYRADEGGAQIAGKQKMIAALQALKAYTAVRDARAEKPAVQAFKISQSPRSGFMHLFATHPPLDERIAKLEQLR